MNQVPRGRSQLLLLAALFFGPIVTAVLLYFAFPQYQPQGRTNYGELVDPARPLPAVNLHDAEGHEIGEAAFRGHWTWLYRGAAQCDRACQDRLFQLRQIRALLNEKRQRVQRVYLAPPGADLAALQAQLGADHPDLKIYAETGPAQLPDFFAAAPGRANDPQAIDLIDPLRNWLMVYPAGAQSTGILKDIKKLLNLSVIG